MTTIATDGWSMAGDSLASCNAYILNYAPKVHRTEDGKIFGCTGLQADAIKFREWMMYGQVTEPPTVDEGFGALVLNQDGSILSYGKDMTPCPWIAPAAIGSGDELAMGAMLAGASPERAVEIAMMRDRKSGGEITVEHLRPDLVKAA